MEIPIHFTDLAWTTIKQIRASKIHHSQLGVRVAVKGSGCSGTSYALGFDKWEPGDMIFEIDSIPVYIQKQHLFYLFQLQIDYISDNMQSGFVFAPLPSDK